MSGKGRTKRSAAAGAGAAAAGAGAAAAPTAAADAALVRDCQLALDGVGRNAKKAVERAEAAVKSASTGGSSIAHRTLALVHRERA